MVGAMRWNNSSNSFRHRLAQGANDSFSNCARVFAPQLFLPAKALVHRQRLQLIHDSHAHLHQPMPMPQQCRRLRFSESGTQIRGNRFSSSSFRISRASSRSVFCFLTRFVLISGGSPIHSSKPNSATSRSNQREYPAASIPSRRFLVASGLDRISLLVHYCGSVPVHHTDQSLHLRMQSSESSGGNQTPLNHHIRLLPPEPAVVNQPQSTLDKEPTLLCDHAAFPQNQVSGSAATLRGLRYSQWMALNPNLES
jgi:hypothetical protein